MSTPYDSQNSFDFELPEQPEFDLTQTENTEVVRGEVNATQQNPTEKEKASKQQTQQLEKLGFCQFVDWDEDEIYNDEPPSCIHYSIEWKVTLNNRMVSKDTEPDVVLAPALFWRYILQLKLEKLLCKKLAKNRAIKSEDINVVISVTERSQRDLTKRFDDTDVDWVVIERQLVKWAELFRAGKKLRINLSFNYVETGEPLATSSRKAAKRGASSTTQQMLTERAVQLDVEQESSGQPSIWRDVYNLMRCPGPSCNLGPHCWLDPVGKKHYKLRTHHLRSLIQYVEQGHVLQTHDDMPEDVRQQLYAEEQQGIERRQKPAVISTTNFPPINITNVLSASTSQKPPAPEMPLASTPFDHLDIPGPRDKAVKDYCAWQESQVQDPTLKQAYQDVYKVIMDDAMDLELIRQDPDPEYLVKRGVKRGIALHIVGDIEDWVKCKRARTEE